MDNLKPMTREESIISGNDLKPLNRHEYYLKHLKGKGGGGGTAANGIVVRPVTQDEVAGLLPEGSSIAVDGYGAVLVDVYFNDVARSYPVSVYRMVKNVENPYYAIIDAHDTTGTKKPVPIRIADQPEIVDKCTDKPNGMFIRLTIDKSFESSGSIIDGLEWRFIIPDDVGFTTYLAGGVA